MVGLLCGLGGGGRGLGGGCALEAGARDITPVPRR